MRQYLYTLLYILGLALPLSAQRAQYGKMSPAVRQAVRTHGSTTGQAGVFFVRITDDADAVLKAHSSRSLAQAGNIHIAAIPLDQLAPLSRDGRVLRIEGKRLPDPLLDSTAIHIQAVPVHEGQGLPQAFTGKGVVTGVMDIGFDLTNPNFYSRDTTDYRIRAFWDFLAEDTVGSRQPVGRDYSDGDEIRALGCCRDGREQMHGTHTLGIAAGSGYDTAYRGLAPESDICLVANAVTSDTVFIAPQDYYKYTFATDALGFKYIFDYAKSVGKPCVISFSEGSSQDFWGYDQLYYEMLDSLTGPGRILVVAAGNQGHLKSWFRKPQGEPSAGTFVSAERQMLVTCKAAEPFSIRLVNYRGTERDTVVISTADVVAQQDSTLRTTLATGDGTGLNILAEAYPSCYVPEEICYDLTLSGPGGVAARYPLSMEVVGIEADIEVYRTSGTFRTNSLNPTLAAGETNHNILSPGSAPGVVCVGNNAYRTGIVNHEGTWIPFDGTQHGLISPYSSVGPTYDGRTKPDVVAPGINIISSHSSYYMEQHDDPLYLTSCTSLYDFNGRTYGWRADSGTSMSCPAVAGAIALWLQAKPDLTQQEVIDIFRRTCRRPDPSLDYPNNSYGYGEIDVYAGLLDILGLNGIRALSHRQSPARFSVGDGRLTITLAAESSVPLRFRLYTTDGRLIADRPLPAHQANYSIAVGHLPSAVYAVQIDGPDDVRGSTLIRP